MVRQVVVATALLLAGACGDPSPAGPGGLPAPGVPRADLVPAGIEAPANAEAGGTFTMSVGVRNAGTLDVGPGWMVRIYLSGNQTIEPSDTLIDQFFTSRDLGPGRTDSYLRNKKLSGLLPAGTYFLGSIVDATGVVDEAVETNNARATGSTVLITAAPTTQ